MQSLSRTTRLGAAVGALAFAALGIACSAAPGSEESLQSNEALNLVCPAGETHTCSLDGPPGSPVVCSPCTPLTIWNELIGRNGIPTTFCGPGSTSVPVPPELAVLGCVIGATNFGQAVWACPTANDALLPHAIPEMSNGLPPCTASATAAHESTYIAKTTTTTTGPTCYVVESAAVSLAPCFGALPANWEFVWLHVNVPGQASSDSVAGGCGGGCPDPNKPVISH